MRSRCHATAMLLLCSAAMLSSCTCPCFDEDAGLGLLQAGVRAPLATALDNRDVDLVIAIERAQTWLESDDAVAEFESLGKPDARYDMIESNRRFLAFLVEAGTGEEIARRIFDAGLQPFPYEVMFTGYFAPEYEASRVRTDQFTVPLYTLPADLQRDRDATWRARSEIESEKLLAGQELVWLADPLDAFLIHVNGSARLRLTDGTVMHVGHSGTNNLEYTSIGRLMIDDDRATAEEMSIPTIRRIYEEDSEYVLGLIAQNDRYVFFEEIDESAWPRGGMGMVITPMRSVAVDPKHYPPGSVLLVVTELATPDGGFEPFVQLMVAQDVGGAIKGSDRIDLFIGVGDEAGEIAGRQVAEGVVYPLVLFPASDDPK